MSDPRKSKRWLLTLGFVGVVVAVLFGRPLLDQLKEKPVPTPPEVKLPSPPEVKLPPSPGELAKPRLTRAQEECDRAIDEHVKALDTFIAYSKRNTRAFAEDALSWKSKGILVVANLPFADSDGHKKFIREKFGEFIFKPQQLEDAVRQVIKSYLAHVRNIESKMLVDLRADTADFPSTFTIAQIDESKVQAAYDEAISRAIEATGSDLGANIANELVTIIASEILTQVAVRLGVSASILGTGAASGWATLGIGAVIGLIVDQIVSWVWDWYADPRGNLARNLDNKLDEINRLIVNGQNGLRSRLQEYARERACFRHEAVLTILRPPTGGTK
jgi:hypothetical protein